jgi:hypothetical protein
MSVTAPKMDDNSSTNKGAGANLEDEKNIFKDADRDVNSVPEANTPVTAASNITFCTPSFAETWKQTPSLP